MPTASVAAPPVRPNKRFLADLLRQFGPSAPTVTGKSQRRHFRRRLRRGVAFHVHAEINARIERAGGDQRHDGHQRFQAHRAVANRPRVAFARDDLRRRAAGDQRVKAGNRPARNGDEAERKNFPGTTGPEPSTNGVSAGICRCGSTRKIPSASAKIVPSFMNVLR